MLHLLFIWLYASCIYSGRGFCVQWQFSVALNCIKMLCLVVPVPPHPPPPPHP